jgi:hypothetical protein
MALPQPGQRSLGNMGIAIVYNGLINVASAEPPEIPAVLFLTVPGLVKLRYG